MFSQDIVYISTAKLVTVNNCISLLKRPGEPNPCRVFNNSVKSIVWAFTRFKSEGKVGDVRFLASLGNSMIK